MPRNKYILTMSLLATVLLWSQVTILLYADSSVRIREETLVIPAYKIGNPDLNPIFYSGRAYQGAKGPVYPYPMLDKLTDTKEMKAYKALCLENDFIKICVLPEIGGRIFSAEDKTNGYDFFYRQHVIKPALIGMLGAWISGGVEWNFPHHHRASGFMDVDYTLTDNPDGSKTIWVGEIELRHRMKWVVGLTLYPDRSYLEATVKLFNRTPLAHSFLWWANVSVYTSPEYQVIFPPGTEYATFHGKNQFSQWPIAHEVFNRLDYTKGVDVSWWKNHPAGTSFFAWNCEEDFFAGYDHGKKAGVVHVADHHAVPGKKFWTWGTGAQGQMWEKILTETDGPYLELMVGAYSDNQPDYSWIQPYEVKTLNHYWYPLRETGGVKAANLEAVCNLEVSPKKAALIAFNTTSSHKGAKAVLETDGKIIWEQKLNISPQNPFWKEINLSPDVNEQELRAILLNSEGKTLISYKPQAKEKTPMPEPVKPPPPPQEIKTVEELYLTGLRLEQFYNPAFEPYPYYEEALKRDPGESRVNASLGILYLKRGMFKEAEEKFKTSLQRLTKNYTSPKDGEAFYYLAVALRAQGKKNIAYDAFYKATWSQAWSAAGYYALAELECEKGNYSKALEFLERSLSSNSLNTKAQNLKAAALRRLGRFNEAKRAGLEALAFDPLDFWSKNEVFLVESALGEKNKAAADLNSLRAEMRDSVHSYLELAADYGNCGFFDEAVEVLTRLVGSEAKEPSTYPLLYYYLGYFFDKKGEEEKAKKYYQLGSRMSPDYCFPFQLESIDVLQTAEKYNPSDARAPYYLGNLLFDLQPERAVEEWEKSRSLDEDFFSVHRNLGLAYARVKNDVPKAVASLEKAVACNSQDPRLYHELDTLYEAGGFAPEKRLELLEKNHDVVVERDDSLSREIALCVQLGKYDRALGLLASRHFHLWEGGGQIHDVYVDAHLLRGEESFAAGHFKEALKDFEQALEYPENLEVGRPHQDIRSFQTYYLIGTVHEAMGKRTKAKEFYEKAVASEIAGSDVSYYQGLAYRKIGKEKEALRVFDSLIQFGKERLGALPSMDFFEKFGERQSAIAGRANAHYLLGLGYLGKGMKREAGDEFKKAVELNINHWKARRQLDKMGTVPND
jgi:tetratricopeptide (TPR) repeat protein